MLRIELPEAATVHWSAGAADGWSDVETQDTGLGVHVAELPTEGLAVGAKLAFTWRRTRDGGWVGENFSVAVRG